MIEASEGLVGACTMCRARRRSKGNGITAGTILLVLRNIEIEERREEDQNLGTNKEYKLWRKCIVVCFFFCQMKN